MAILMTQLGYSFQTNDVRFLKSDESITISNKNALIIFEPSIYEWVYRYKIHEKLKEKSNAYEDVIRKSKDITEKEIKYRTKIVYKVKTEKEIVKIKDKIIIAKTRNTWLTIGIGGGLLVGILGGYGLGTLLNK